MTRLVSTLLTAVLLCGCITTERAAPAAAVAPEVVVSRASELWSVDWEGRRVGWVVRYTPTSAPADAFLSVRNPWHQELGMIDSEGRWWRFEPHRSGPRLVGAGATAEGVAALLGLGGPPVLSPRPVEDLAPQGP